VDQEWSWKAHWIARRMDLDTLEIDCTDAYCTSGCCRLAMMFSPHFGRFKFGLPNRIIAQGAKSADEESEIVRLITDGHHQTCLDEGLGWEGDEELSSGWGGGTNAAGEGETDSEKDVEWSSVDDEEMKSEEEEEINLEEEVEWSSEGEQY